VLNSYISFFLFYPPSYSFKLLISASGIRSTVWSIKGWETTLIAKIIAVENVSDENLKEGDDIPTNQHADDVNIYNSLRLYRKERNILKTLEDCKGTIKFIYSIEDDESLILICYPRCFGGSLYTVAIERYPMTEEMLCSLVYAIVAVVKDVHNEGIVHGGIRAEHILLKERWSNNNRPELVLIDFGYSNYNDCVYKDPMVVQRRSLHYTAPELLSKGKEGLPIYYSSTLDWWAVGITLYLMVYGKYPFDSLNRRDLAQKIITADPIFNAGPPPGLVMIIRGLLRKEPEVRYGASETLSNSWLR